MGQAVLNEPVTRYAEGGVCLLILLEISSLSLSLSIDLGLVPPYCGNWDLSSLFDDETVG